MRNHLDIFIHKNINFLLNLFKKLKHLILLKLSKNRYHNIAYMLELTDVDSLLDIV